MDFKNKVAVVTGGFRGIGKAVAVKLAALGADVAIIGRSNGDNAVEEISAYGTKVKAYCCNVADFEECGNTINSILEDFGKIDFLVNNAGITKDNLVLKMEEADFDAVIDVNLKGTFNMVKHTYKMFMKQRSGRIVNVSSVVGLNGNAGQVNYASSKAGVIGLSKSLAKELAGRGVSVNVVAPGYIDTDMTDALSDKIKEEIANSIPMKRRGKTEDVANVIAFLCSDYASYVTGEVIRVDGGMAM